jgi:hypothetical protein
VRVSLGTRRRNTTRTSSQRSSSTLTNDQNLAGEAVPDWLPETFRRSSLTESTRALLTSYQEAVQRMHAATQQRAEALRTVVELEEELDHLRALIASRLALEHHDDLSRQADALLAAVQHPGGNF